MLKRFWQLFWQSVSYSSLSRASRAYCSDSRDRPASPGSRDTSPCTPFPSEDSNEPTSRGRDWRAATGCCAGFGLDRWNTVTPPPYRNCLESAAARPPCTAFSTSPLQTETVPVRFPHAALEPLRCESAGHRQGRTGHSASHPDICTHYTQN